VGLRYNTPMQVSYKCDYALKVLLELTLHKDQGILTSQEMSKKLDIPLKFLEQVLSDLRKGGFVESKRGNMGGYKIVGDPAKITVGMIVRQIDGNIEPIDCVNDSYKGCRDIRNCAFRKTWCCVNQAISNVVDKTTIEDVAKDVRASNDSPNYYI
jgi:Rrf2 family transcriptional regulator, cysteine metabolism repressor